MKTRNFVTTALVWISVSMTALASPLACASIPQRDVLWSGANVLINRPAPRKVSGHEFEVIASERSAWLQQNHPDN